MKQDFIIGNVIFLLFCVIVFKNLYNRLTWTEQDVNWTRTWQNKGIQTSYKRDFISKNFIINAWQGPKYITL